MHRRGRVAVAVGRVWAGLPVDCPVPAQAPVRLGHLFLQALALCQAAGMVRLGRVALDGTKLRTNASRRKAMSYARMSEKEKVLAQEVSDLLAEAEAIDKSRGREVRQEPTRRRTARGTAPSRGQAGEDPRHEGCVGGRGRRAGGRAVAAAFS